MMSRKEAKMKKEIRIHSKKRMTHMLMRKMAKKRTRKKLIERRGWLGKREKKKGSEKERKKSSSRGRGRKKCWKRRKRKNEKDREKGMRGRKRSARKMLTKKKEVLGLAIIRGRLKRMTLGQAH